MSLKFIALSGTTGVTENLYIYEYGDEIIIVDCGVGFPESEMHGVDLVIPDFSYLKQNASKIKAVLITHGHEDHIGALPFLFREVGQFPIYSTLLVSGFIEDKFSDYKMKAPKINVFNPEKDVLAISSFAIHPFRISHSVPDAVGFVIDTPEGKIFHVADYKFDWTPVDGRPFDIARAASLVSGGVLATCSDCLGSTTPGYTESERQIETKIEDIVSKATGQVFFTTISSNISRMKQALNVAEKLGRQATFVGRSIDTKAAIAYELGYLNYKKGLVVTNKEAIKLPKDKVLYVISGSYGQPGSALYRVAMGEHDYLKAERGDSVIFSADPAPPGSKANVDFLVDRFIEGGVHVHYYDLQEDLHVSGHGSTEDIKLLLSLTKPSYFIPIGGTVRHMRAFSDIALSMGASPDRVFEPMAGDIIEFKDGHGKKSGNIPVKQVLVDGLGIGDVGEIVLRDRKKLSNEGVAIILLQIESGSGKLISDPEIISRGFTFGEKKKDLFPKAAKALLHELAKKKVLNRKVIMDVTSDFLEKFFYKEIGRRPMILPVVAEI